MGEVLESAVNDSSSEAMREHKLRPALQPKVEIVSFNEGKDLEYKLAVEVLPEFEPMDFAELKLERLRPEVPDAGDRYRARAHGEAAAQGRGGRPRRPPMATSS